MEDTCCELLPLVRKMSFNKSPWACSWSLPASLTNFILSSCVSAILHDLIATSFGPSLVVMTPVCTSPNWPPPIRSPISITSNETYHSDSADRHRGGGGGGESGVCGRSYELVN